MAKDKAPWMKWYPADWRQEPTLRLCSRAARSLWCDMLGLMHEAEPYGLLLVSGRALNERQLAAVLGDNEKDVRGWLSELEEAGVFSRNEEGVIFSRRMLRDKAKEEENRRNGKAGGNPRLGAKDKAGDKAPPADEDKAGVKGGDKAHIPEARSQRPDTRNPEAKDRHGAAAAPPASAGPGLDLTLPVAQDRSLDEAASRWNEMAERAGLARVVLLNDTRRGALKRRLAECGGLDGWDTALKRVENSPFLTGDNDRGWKIDFDTLLKPAKFTKLMEGGYERSKPVARPTASGDAGVAVADKILDHLRGEAA
jgi:hypothetical protein